VSETFRESMVVAKLGHILIHSQYTVNIWWRTFRSPNLITSLYIFTTSHVFFVSFRKTRQDMMGVNYENKLTLN
jgi:hypothetical protein